MARLRWLSITTTLFTGSQSWVRLTRRYATQEWLLYTTTSRAGIGSSADGCALSVRSPHNWSPLAAQTLSSVSEHAMQTQHNRSAVLKSRLIIAHIFSTQWLTEYSLFLLSDLIVYFLQQYCLKKLFRAYK